jgi:hypothetical protein
MNYVFYLTGEMLATGILEEFRNALRVVMLGFIGRQRKKASYSLACTRKSNRLSHVTVL